jgi:hypothetical protein
MAYSPDVIERLRRLIDDTDDPPVYSDADLTAYLDEFSGDVNKAAAAIWREKAAKYAGLVDMKEGTSSRALSQLYKNALAIADDLDPGEDDGTFFPTTVAIERR